MGRTEEVAPHEFGRGQGETSVETQPIHGIGGDPFRLPRVRRQILAFLLLVIFGWRRTKEAVQNRAKTAQVFALFTDIPVHVVVPVVILQ